MKQPKIEEKKLHTALLQFIFPFSINRNCQKPLKAQLKHDRFIPFSLDNLELETAFYGEGYRVSHSNLERYYLPFTNNVIFPHKQSEDVFQRYSKSLNLACVMESKDWSMEVCIHSVDVVLCPFDLCFITIRAEILSSGITYTQALEFVNRFRVLQNVNNQDDNSFLVYESKQYEEVELFIFEALVPGMLPFLDKEELGDSYFEDLPFFVDERMYVQGLIAFEDEMELTYEDLYRAARVDGSSPDGKPYISSTNMDYIERYLEAHLYDRWGPNTYYVMEETSFFCLTNLVKAHTVPLANHMYGEYYYGVLINLFYKIVLLKLSNHYSHIQLDQNQERIEKLIRSITTFSAKYYFLEVVSQSQGKEIFLMLRKHLGSDELFEEVKITLNDLYKYQDNFTTKRSNYLLLILTIYTVISGIYGMNQVIEDLKAPVDWKKLLHYSIFEYLALGVTVSGIFIALGLGVSTLFKLISDWRKRNKVK